jgi:membrane protein YqaA with SNARE-associated domain
LETQRAEKLRFFFSNLMRGMAFLILIIGGYLVAKKYGGFDLKEMMGPLYESPKVIFSIFLISEVVFGIIPPEFFMIWSQRHNDLPLFISNVAVLSLISYAAGVIGYWFGAYLNRTTAYRFVKRKVFGKFEKQFNKYGGFLVVVASMTPIPFSGICMLVGSVKYPFTKFLMYSMTRFLRFILYGFIIWEAHVA